MICLKPFEENELKTLLNVDSSKQEDIQENKHLLKILHLAQKKPLYTLEELSMEIFNSKTDQKKVLRLILNASRLNFLSSKIDQRENTVHFLEIK